MRFQVNAIFALQTRQGLAFGCAREMDGERMIFQVPATLVLGELMDFRMQLAGRPEMVTGSVRIEAEYPGPVGELPLVEARLVAMSEQNRSLLQGWLVERSASFSREPNSFKVGSLNRGRRSESLRSRIRRRHGGQGLKPVADTSSSAAPPQGRDAITAALKASLKRTSRAQLPAQRPIGASPRPAPPAFTVASPTPPPPPGSPVPPPLAAPPVAAPARPPEPAPPPAAPAPPSAPTPLRVGTDPSIAIRLGSQPVMIRVRYRTHAAFVREHDQHLRGSGLFLPVSEVEALKVRGTRALVRLDLPSGAVVVCPAEVVAPMSRGVGLALELTGPQRQVLVAEAEQGGLPTP